VRVEGHVADEHDVVIASDILEGASERLLRCLPVAAEELLIGTHNARGRIHQTLAVRVVARPGDQCAYSRLGLLATRPRPIHRTITSTRERFDEGLHHPSP